MSGGTGAVSGPAFFAVRSPWIGHRSGVGPAFHIFGRSEC